MPNNNNNNSTTRIGGRRGKYSTLHKPHVIPAAGTSTASPSASASVAPSIFAEYWPDDLVTQGLADGQLLRGQLRLNLTNPTEGYITIPGIRHDLLVKVGGW